MKLKKRLINYVDEGYSPKEAAETVAKEMSIELSENSTTVINEIFKPKIDNYEIL